MPRHALVPTFYEQDPGTGQWLTRDGTDPDEQERIYSNRGLFTKIGEGTGSWGTGVVGLSSTSTPGLMTRMLETLDLHDGHTVRPRRQPGPASAAFRPRRGPLRPQLGRLHGPAPVNPG